MSFLSDMAADFKVILRLVYASMVGLTHLLIFHVRLWFDRLCMLSIAMGWGGYLLGGDRADGLMVVFTTVWIYLTGVLVIAPVWRRLRPEPLRCASREDDSEPMESRDDGRFLRIRVPRAVPAGAPVLLTVALLVDLAAEEPKLYAAVDVPRGLPDSLQRLAADHLIHIGEHIADSGIPHLPKGGSVTVSARVGEESR